jgi:hypothetical protein
VHADANEEEDEDACEDEEGDELENEAAEEYLWGMMAQGGEGERGDVRGTLSGIWSRRRWYCQIEIQFRPSPAGRNWEWAKETRREMDDYDAHLDEKCGNVGSDEDARDEARFYDKILVHLEVAREASQEDIVCCDERAGLVL